jgi:hypothetical protein
MRAILVAPFLLLASVAGATEPEKKVEVAADPPVVVEDQTKRKSQKLDGIVDKAAVMESLGYGKDGTKIVKETSGQKATVE